jgi:hypothetical protein
MESMLLKELKVELELAIREYRVSLTIFPIDREFIKTAKEKLDIASENYNSELDKIIKESK